MVEKRVWMTNEEGADVLAKGQADVLPRSATDSERFKRAYQLITSAYCELAIMLPNDAYAACEEIAAHVEEQIHRKDHEMDALATSLQVKRFKC